MEENPYQEKGVEIHIEGFKLIFVSKNTLKCVGGRKTQRSNKSPEK
jgi:hypothetical protein